MQQSKPNKMTVRAVEMPFAQWESELRLTTGLSDA